MDTCDPKTLGVMPPVRQFGHLYAFVRNELAGVIGLSRLIHPTSIGFDYAARIGYESSGVKQIFPAQIVGISQGSLPIAKPKRDWLTAKELSGSREWYCTCFISRLLAFARQVSVHNARMDDVQELIERSLGQLRGSARFLLCGLRCQLACHSRQRNLGRFF